MDGTDISGRGGRPGYSAREDGESDNGEERENLSRETVTRFLLPTHDWCVTAETGGRVLNVLEESAMSIY
jgi:hypothetical protein